MCSSVMMASYDCGGLQMLCVKNVVHALHVKWLDWIDKDAGATWSRLCWSWITDRIPSLLWHWIRMVSETDLSKLPVFYTGILHSFAFVNNVFYTQNKNRISDFPLNLWCHPYSPVVNHKMCAAGYFVGKDLPMAVGKVDSTLVCRKVQGAFLVCYHLQTVFGYWLPHGVPGSHLLHPELILSMKTLLLKQVSETLSLVKWDLALGIMLTSKGEAQMIFTWMLKKYKFTKFCEVNFKIFTNILVTPKILLCIKKKSSLSKCCYCGEEASLDHILH